CFLLFFFSSRRRHTRSKRDWSSDVCSSDLTITVLQFKTHREVSLPITDEVMFALLDYIKNVRPKVDSANSHFLRTAGPHFPDSQIGRASCRERVEISVVEGGHNRKNNSTNE